MTARRMTKQELREDPFFHGLERSRDILARYWRPLVIVVLILLTGAVVVTLVNRGRAASESDAATYVARAQDDLVAGEYQSALQMAQEAAERYPRTRAGRKALLAIAEAQLGLGDAAAARTAYETAREKLRTDPKLFTSARRGLAVALEQQGELAAAAELYDELGQNAEPPAGRLYDLYSAARCWDRAGDLSRAIASLERLVADFPNPEERVAADVTATAHVLLAEYRYRSTKPN